MTQKRIMHIIRESILVTASVLMTGSFAWAEVYLVHEDRSLDSIQYRFFYEPERLAAAKQTDEIRIPSEWEELDFHTIDVPSKKASSNQKGILLLNDSEFNYSKYSSSVNDSDILLKQVQVGSFSGTQITLNNLEEEKFEFTVSFPRNDSKKKNVQSRKMDTAEKRNAELIFANAASVKKIDLLETISKKSSIQKNEPQDVLKFVYQHDGEVMAYNTDDLNDFVNLQLTHHGSVLPIGGEFDDRNWFYAPRRSTKTDINDAVFVSSNNTSPSLIMERREAFINLSPNREEVARTRTKVFDENLVYERSVKNPIGERFVYYRASTGQTKLTETVIFDELTTTTISASVKIIGLNASSVEPDHYATLSFNGGVEVTESWDGQTEKNIDFTFEVEEDSSPRIRPITLEHQIPSIPGGPPADLQNLESFELTWVGYPRLTDDQMITLKIRDEPTSVSQLVTIGGFEPSTKPDDILLLDITDETNPVRILNALTFPHQAGGVAIEFEALPGSTTFYAQSFDTLPEVTVPVQKQMIPEVLPQELRGVYIADSSYHDELQPLLDLRGEGYICIDPQVAYDNFNGGQESPEAIQDLIRYVFENSGSRVTFPTILLVGTASFDWKNDLGLHDAPQVPTFIDESVDTGFTIENCVDYPYGLLFGDDDFLDGNIGRLPVKTEEELTLIIDRIVAHESKVPEFTEAFRPALFVTDDDPILLLDVNIWPQYWNELGAPFNEIIVDAASDGSAEKEQLKTFLEASPNGPSFVFYVGHGNLTRWGDERILQSSDLINIDLDEKWPFVTTFTCLNGYYAFPGSATRVLGEEWLLDTTGGSIANITPCSVDFYSFQQAFAIEVMELITLSNQRRPPTVGELLTLSRINYESKFPNLDSTNREYLLFGDPDSPHTIFSPILNDIDVDDSFLIY